MLPFVSPLSKQTSLHLKPAHPKGESQKPARPKGGSQTLLAPSPGTASLLGRSGAGFGASARRPGWCSSKVRDSALRKVALFSFVIHRCRILLRSPGPRPPPVFRSAICDCLSLNVSVSFLSLPARPTRSETVSLLGLVPLLAHALLAYFSPCPPSTYCYCRFPRLLSFNVSFSRRLLLLPKRRGPTRPTDQGQSDRTESAVGG